MNVEKILSRICAGERASVDEARLLFLYAPLSLLIEAAFNIKYQRFGKKVFFIENVHIEPTSHCVYQCKFCSFHKSPGEIGYWDYSINEIKAFLEKLPLSIKEIHITGGVHPDRDVYWYADLLKKIKELRPQSQIKAFTAIEINFMCKKAGVSLEEGLLILKESGLHSLAGGGAEIFNDDVRSELCPEKGDSSLWINVHQTAHHLGIFSNATMLYGHIETIDHRLEHMSKIREMQDKTNGFQAFIPLKFRNQNNYLSHLQEVLFIEDVKMFALARIFFNNIPHIKAYWPMLGRDKAAFLLHAGVDDIDGTIYDSTKIYTMSGSEEQQPTITKDLISKENFIPVERDIFYKEINF